MQPLFCAQTPSSNGVCFAHRCAPGSSPCCVPAPDCSPAPLPAAAPRRIPGDHRHHRFVPADGGVDRRIADFMPPKPQLDAPTYRPPVGHDKGHCRPVRALDGHRLRTGQGRAGAINTTARFSSIENATDPAESPAYRQSPSASPVTTFSIASAASPVESLISTEGCAARKRSRIGGRWL